MRFNLGGAEEPVADVVEHTVAFQVLSKIPKRDQRKSQPRNARGKSPVSNPSNGLSKLRHARHLWLNPRGNSDA